MYNLVSNLFRRSILSKAQFPISSESFQLRKFAGTLPMMLAREYYISLLRYVEEVIANAIFPFCTSDMIALGLILQTLS
jgi:hypothetical protein